MNVRIVKAEYGGHPWYAVPEGAEPHSNNAVWLDSGRRSIETSFGRLSTDGGVRFFTRKRLLVEALDVNGHTVVVNGT